MYLFNLRENWRAHTASTRMSESPAVIFLRHYGQTCQFKHVAIDCQSGPRHRFYSGNMYAVFTTHENTNNILPVTLMDLKLIEETMRVMPYPSRDAIISHMTPQIREANIDFNRYTEIVRQLREGGLSRRQLTAA